MARIRCAKADCKDKISPPSGRYCAQHRKEHGQMLLAQLAKIEKET